MTDPTTWVPDERRHLLGTYADLLAFWNERVNLVARPSVDAIRDHHIRHCLALAFRSFPDDSVVVDWGTGGGLPAVPLAIAFPAIRVVAVDSTAKKSAALKAICRELALDNVEVWNGRAEIWPGAADYCVSRATAPLRKLWQWSRRVLTVDEERAGSPGNPVDAREVWAPGLICLKGGDLAKEIRQVKAPVGRWSVSEILGGTGYQDKYILQVTRPESARDNG